MLNISAYKIYFFSFIIFVCFSKSFEFEYVVVANNASVRNSRIVKRQIPHKDGLNIKEFYVITKVANRFSETSVISKVENSNIYANQTAFSVVLPEGAFISGFYMDIDGKRYRGYVKEKQEARKLFGNQLSTGQTAGHVSVSTRNANRFTVNINVNALSKVKFSLNYEELLERQNGEYEIVTNIQPGKIVKKLLVEVTINESLPLYNVRTPYLRSGNNELLEHKAALDPHAQVRIFNTSAHIIFQPDISRQLEFACAGLGNKEYDGFAGQFVVKYDVNRTNEGGETIYQDEFLLNFFAPKGFDPLPKHIVFILDTSGSMEGLKKEQLINAMLKILPQLNKEDIFSIVQYNDQVYVWETDSTKNNVFSGMDVDNLPYGSLAERLQNQHIPPGHAATEENIRKVQTLIENIQAFDGTNIIGSLEIGFLVVQKSQLKYPKKYIPIIVFLTDGLPNVGIESSSEIIKKVRTLNKAGYNTPIYTLCFGSDADWSFLKTLSLQNGGKPTKISESKDASVLLQNFYEKISTPILSNATFNFPKSAGITQSHFPLIFNGSESVVAAKGIAAKDAKLITVSAKSKDGPVNLKSQLGIPLTKLEKVWAYLTVKQLIDQYQATGNTTFSTLAINLALNYSLVSDFTSLVVVKPDNLNGRPIDTEDASIGIFPEPPGELPMCNNIPNYIKKTYGTTESEGVEMTTTEIPTTTLPTTTTIITTTTTATTTEDDIEVLPENNINVSPESDFVGETTPTEIPTTTTEMITCDKSQYGCCYDGVTFSPGPNGDGCDPIPKSESCLLPVNRGGCNNITTKWFYNTINHHCGIFNYSGCGGNDNRFATQNICEHTCVYPEGKERCKLPILLGNCTNKVLMWFYNKSTDKCDKYMYGGCNGNSNRFNSKQECLKMCSPDKLKLMLEDLCFQPKDNGFPRCEGYQKQYYFESSKGHCIQFWFSGCGGNDNRFKDKAECETTCNKAKKLVTCNLPPEPGNYKGYKPAYYFDKSTSSCKTFIYTGRGGNSNRFSTQRECENFCR